LSANCSFSEPDDINQHPTILFISVIILPRSSNDYRRGVGIGHWTYWTLPTLNYNSLWRYRQFTFSRAHYSTHLVFSVCCFRQSTGNGFQWRVSELSPCSSNVILAHSELDWNSTPIVISNNPLII
jgi:hypothetical protein